MEFLLIMTIEGDYLSYGFGAKGISKNITTILKFVISNNPGFFDIFIEWFINGIKKILCKNLSKS